MASPTAGASFEVVAVDRSFLDRLTALVGAALPDEDLRRDDLEACCFDGAWPDGADGTAAGHGVVLATDDGTAALSLVSRPGPDGLAAYVNLVVVHPDVRCGGRATALLEAACARARQWGASSLRLEGAAPYYLWPGVDTDFTPMLALAERTGFEPVGAAHDLVLPSTMRAPMPEGVVCRHVIDDADVDAVRTLVAAHWPSWRAELDRGIESASCLGAFVATDGSAAAPDAAQPPVALGFCCHSVNRYGWLGPIGTDPAHQHRGIGAALMGAACRDLQIAGLATVEIVWVGPDAFYERLGATEGRTYRILARRLS